jgi:hypothetical protein
VAKTGLSWQVRHFGLFNCMYHLEAHVKTVHDNIKDNKCTKCDFAAFSNIIWKHMLKLLCMIISKTTSAQSVTAALQKHHLEAHVKTVHDNIKDNK